MTMKNDIWNFEDLWCKLQIEMKPTDQDDRNRHKAAEKDECNWQRWQLLIKRWQLLTKMRTTDKNKRTTDKNDNYLQIWQLLTRDDSYWQTWQ